MEAPEILLDARHPDVRIDLGMARAEFAQRAATRAFADQLAAIHATLIEALYAGEPEARLEIQVTYQDGRKGSLNARVRVHDVAGAAAAPGRRDLVGA